MLNIIMPAYNAEKTITESLASLVAQHKPRKFILTVVDDCSTDDTLNIVESFKKMIPIRVIALTENKGVGNARQVGIDASECDLISFLDSDDKYFPYTVNLFNREMAIDFPDALYSDFISEQKKKEVLIKGKQYITWFHGKVYRKSFLEKFDIKMPLVRYNEDSGFSTIVHELSEKKAYIPEITYYWCENPNSITRSDGEFNLKSMPNFIKSISYGLAHIDKFKDVYAYPVFYGQLNNFYHYHMEAIYNNYSWVPEIEIELREFFNKFWIEGRIRPEFVVRGFGMKSPKPHEYMTAISPVEWLNKYTNNTYTVADFKVEKKK